MPPQRRADGKSAARKASSSVIIGSARPDQAIEQKEAPAEKPGQVGRKQGRALLRPCQS
jgi:hypothetical protein